MRYLFIGLGSIGQRHLQNLRTLYPYEAVYAYRTDQTNISELDKKYDILSFVNLKEAMIRKPHIVFITNPTNLHMETAMKLLKHDCHMFIEKPISHNTKNVKHLFETMKQKDKICFVGYNYRFHPSIQTIKEILDTKMLGEVYFAQIHVGQYLPDWHSDEDYRLGYAARKNMGGGVVLTLIHEIDYMYWLFGKIKKLYATLEKKSNLEINVEDTASIIAKTNNNITIQLHMDYLQKPPFRICKIVGEKGKLIWNYYANKMFIYQCKTNKWTELQEKCKRNTMYMNELKHFLNCVDGKEKPMVTPEEVMDVMEIVETIKKSSKEKKELYVR